METALISTAIATGGLVIGIILREFGPDWLKAIRHKGDDLKRLLGEWEAVWYVSNGAEKEYIKDRLRITRIAGDKIIGEGKDDKGTYLLEGKYTTGHLINLTYKYQGNVNILTGGLILKVNPIMTECNGKWYGYVKEDCIVGGKVTWMHL